MDNDAKTMHHVCLKIKMKYFADLQSPHEPFIRISFYHVNAETI